MNTIWVEFTKRFWHPAIDRTLFGSVYRLGWIGLGFSRHNLTEWVKAWRNALENAKGAKTKDSRQQH